MPPTATVGRRGWRRALANPMEVPEVSRILPGLPLSFALLVLPALSSDQSAFSMTPQERLASSVRSALKRSSNQYIAGVIEVLEAPQCDSQASEETCWARTRVVDEIAIHNANKETDENPRDEFKWIGGKEASAGDTFVAFLIPSESEPELYLATYLSIVLKDEEIAKFRAIVTEALKK